MTQQSEKEKVPPEILEEEDTPLHSLGSSGGEKEDQLSKEKNALNPLENQRFHLGSTVLGWCIFLMMVCIGISLRWPESELVNNGFEAFKLIVMTILGYLFGSNSSK